MDCNANLTAVALSFKNNASGRLGPWNMGAMFAWLYVHSYPTLELR
jgi:hypothetical protein